MRLYLIRKSAVIFRSVGLAEYFAEFHHKVGIMLIVADRDIAFIGNVVVEPVAVCDVRTFKTVSFKVLHIVFH